MSDTPDTGTPGDANLDTAPASDPGTAPTSAPASDLVSTTLTVEFDWDTEVDAGYLAFAPIGDGEAAHQRTVANPVAGRGELILDFDSDGRLLGVEVLDQRTLPPGITPTV